MKRGIVTLLCLLLCSIVESGDKRHTYADILGKDGIERIVSSELEALPARVSQAKIKVVLKMKEWSIRRISPLSPHKTEHEQAQEELRTGYGKFLGGLADYSRAGKEFAEISPQVAQSFLSSAARCGVVPCSHKCCAFCDPCL